MSTTTVGFTRTLSDGWVVAKRNLIKIKRVPEILVFVLISPIMFVLLFAYVFGGAIDAGPGLDYKEFLIGGIFAQTVVFGSTFSGAAMAEDMQKGFIDRFRSLPMARSAVLVGRTGSDVVYNVLSLIIMALTGLLVGWRAHHGIGKTLGAFALLLLFAYAVSLDHGVGRTDRAERRRDQQRVVHHHHAAHVRVQRLRPDRLVQQGAPTVRRMEPGLGGHPGGA